MVIDGDDELAGLGSRRGEVNGGLPAVGADLADRSDGRVLPAVRYSASPSSGGMKPLAASAASLNLSCIRHAVQSAVAQVAARAEDMLYSPGRPTADDAEGARP